MAIPTSCIFLFMYIYSVNSISTDVSCDTDISKNTDEASNENINNEDQIELFIKSRNTSQSIENVIHNSASDSIEKYSFTPDRLKDPNRKEKKILSSSSDEEIRKPMELQTESPSAKILSQDETVPKSYEIYPEKILSSNEETKSLWPTHDDFWLGKLINYNKQEKNSRTVNDNNTSFDTRKAPQHSTIEINERGYQDNIAANSNDEDEYSTLVDYPYTVSVQRKGAHYTTGALVGERWVLTTAAQFYNVRETIKLFRMRLGSSDCKKGGVVTPIKTITIHPGFVPGQPNHDVAVLRIAQAVPLSSVIKPLEISRVEGPLLSAKFLITYWPRIVVNKRILPPSAKERIKYNSMRMSTQKLIPSHICQKLMETANVTLHRSSLCLKPVKPHHSECMPDAGAPVVAVDGLWGITSGWVSPDCPARILPTVFTRVSEPVIRMWIEDQMRV